MEQSTIREFNPVNNDDAPTIEEARLNLKVSHNLFDMLLAHAQKRNFPSVESFAIYTLTQAVTQKVGQTHIEGPAVMSGESTGKVTGYKGGIVSRG